jgi:hypothetical protein
MAGESRRKAKERKRERERNAITAPKKMGKERERRIRR